MRPAFATLVGLLLARHLGAQPMPLDEVVVSADRVPQPAASVAAHVTVLDRDAIALSPSLAVDDFLRQVPGFQLFRRSSSLVSNPTTQGVSLRGLGASGASRTLVLLDGVPLNDPFGGWIPWSRVPLDGLERVEIVRGPPAAPWGNYAMGGVIDLVTRRPTADDQVEVAGEGGNRGTARGGAWAAGRRGPVGVSLRGDYLGFGGFPVVRDDQRGPIDVDAGSQHGVVDGRLDWTPVPGLDTHLHANLFTEERANGTPLTDNASRAADVDAGAAGVIGGGAWRALAFTKLARFASRFSSQAPDRRSERPASDQFDVPAVAVGAAAQWTRPIGAAHRVSVGLDGSWLDAETDEDGRFLDGRFTVRREAGARQLVGGGWAQAAVAPTPSLHVTGGLRVDGWRSFDGFRRERALAGGRGLRDDRLPANAAVVASPSLALRWDAGRSVALRAGGYRGFRAPTVNELVRGFRLRNDVTEPNPALEPERLYGGEVGVERRGARWDAQLTLYWDVVQDPIANVTLGRGPGDVAPCGVVPAGGVCRQRRNLGALRARGLEADVGVQVARHARLTAGVLWSDSRIVAGPPQLAGRRTAQVPAVSASAGAAWEPPRGPRAGVELRYVGQQFEDDVNRLSLGGFAVADVFLGWRIGERWEVFLRVENALDRTYPVGRTGDGLVTVGTPLLAHGGVRARF